MENVYFINKEIWKMMQEIDLFWTYFDKKDILKLI